MNKLIATMFLSTLMALPTIAVADPYYTVVQGRGAGADNRVNITSHAGGGKIKCSVGLDAYLHRNHEQNWSRFIHVQWKGLYGVTSHEWDFQDANGKWCPLWNRRGWIDKADPDLRVRQNLSTGYFRILPVPKTW